MAFCNCQYWPLACAPRPRAAAAANQQIRFCGRYGGSLFGDRDFIGLAVQLGENVALMDAIVIIDENPGYLATDTSGNERYVPIHIGVVGGDRIEGQLNPRDAKFPDRRQHQSGQRPER
jgi:hypothetical protein